ncbi:MAG TPA: glycosyltransferase family 4 protein [Acetobacteraceae bacterium]
MKLLVWQWGRRGSGPRYGASLAASLRSLDGVSAVLSLSAQSEILCGTAPPVCELPFSTYGGFAGLLLRILSTPILLGRLAACLRQIRPDVAICAMPAPLDMLMAMALHRAGVRFLVVVHDAYLHPGDGFPLQMTLQRLLMRRADGLIALSDHVAGQLRKLDLVGGRPLIMTSHPPLVFGAPPPLPRAHGGKLRLLSFGRLLPYKGLDLLAEALRLLGPKPDVEIRVVGSGPETPVLEALRQMPGVTVENRWVPEAEVGGVLSWADALVLSHREASQSGVAAAAIAARRWVVATRVGGITEQLQHESQARLCDPTPASLAAELERLRTSPPQATQHDDPGATWHEAATDLMRQISAVFGRG